MEKTSMEGRHNEEKVLTNIAAMKERGYGCNKDMMGDME